jgi:hypothetical protein
MTNVTEHKTYPSAKCTLCHETTLRICILHDKCEKDYHDERECTDVALQIFEVRRRMARDRAWLTERGF